MKARNPATQPSTAAAFPARRIVACIAFIIGHHLQSGSALASAPGPHVVPQQTPPVSTVPVDSPGALPQQTTSSDQVWRDPETGVEFVRIPGGEFDMGSNSFSNEKPVHRVRIAEFWLAKTEVTQAQWRAIVGSAPSKQRGCDDCPVGDVSWEDVQKYLKRTDYRLPTEAEWEYAAGGGAEHQRWAGTNNETKLGEYVWYRGNSTNMPHPVGQKKPNNFGLFDMSGNVYEWCADWYQADYYKNSPTDNPQGPATGTFRVARGGSWILDPRIAGVTFRLKALPSRRRTYLGFRPALLAAPKVSPHR